MHDEDKLVGKAKKRFLNYFADSSNNVESEEWLKLECLLEQSYLHPVCGSPPMSDVSKVICKLFFPHPQCSPINVKSMKTVELLEHC
jgi:hypothetical protein